MGLESARSLRSRFLGFREKNVFLSPRASDGASAQQEKKRSPFDAHF